MKTQGFQFISQQVQFYRAFVFFLALHLMLVSCTKKKSEDSKDKSMSTSTKTQKVSTLPESVHKEAKTLFKARCVTCHGERGVGDGPASKGLTPAPKDFTSSSWQKTVTDEHLEKIIKFGGASVGKSPAMPPNPDLNGKPQVVQALVQFIRSLEEKK